MFPINKINFNPLPNYQFDTQRASFSLSTIEKQHIHFLDSLDANENISYPLHSYDEALALLTPLYDKDYIENKSKINFVSTMNTINRLPIKNVALSIGILFGIINIAAMLI
ncbi:hypothetical protein [Arsenophonus sp.]|uniref:hypothetical protein n=1 Tax=Arsenophonus sp. TaxID=1872640 RepID=UPI00286163E9|nr:hypothetical protein [Arsenophonus sp.]MDR5618094.1 hypothetical protein [Arsenophonus sp.]